MLFVIFFDVFQLKNMGLFIKNGHLTQSYRPVLPEASSFFCLTNSNRFIISIIFVKILFEMEKILRVV